MNFQSIIKAKINRSVYFFVLNHYFTSFTLGAGGTVLVCVFYLVLVNHYFTSFTWGVGGTILVHVSLTTVTIVQFWLRAVI